MYFRYFSCLKKKIPRPNKSPSQNMTEQGTAFTPPKTTSQSFRFAYVVRWLDKNQETISPNAFLNNGALKTMEYQLRKTPPNKNKNNKFRLVPQLSEKWQSLMAASPTSNRRKVLDLMEISALITVASSWRRFG